jgi:predicted SAM-dependent methyltransferase
MKQVKINVGCGWYFAPGYINVDMVIPTEHQGSGKFVKGDILALPFEDNYADQIEAHQVMEHLSMQDQVPAYKEIYRVLKKGGRFIMDVPSFNGLCLEWLGMEVRSSEFNPQNWYDRAEEFYGIQIHEGEYHRCPMTPSWVAYALTQAGFNKPKGIVLFPKHGTMPRDKKFGIMSSSPKPFGDQTGFRHETIFAEVTK